MKKARGRTTHAEISVIRSNTMGRSRTEQTNDQIVDAMSKHVTGAAILARFCLPFSKEEFLDLCGTAYDGANEVAQKHAAKVKGDSNGP